MVGFVEAFADFYLLSDTLDFRALEKDNCFLQLGRASVFIAPYE